MKDRIKTIKAGRTQNDLTGQKVAAANIPENNAPQIMRSEEKSRRVYRWMVTGYVAAGLVLMIIYASEKNWYLMAQSAGTLAALGAIFGFLHLLKIKPVYSLYAVIVAFTFAAYTLGVACALYKITPLYDKLLHMLSGTLVMMLALPLFYALKSGHQVEKGDCLLAVCFCIMTSLAVAGVWEIAEYALSLMAGIDPQNVAATGVTDTMQDMIVCTAGTLLAVPSLIRFYRTGRGGLLYTPAQVFIEKNLRTGEREFERTSERKNVE